MTRLDLAPPPLVASIADAVHRAGGQALLVGGSVRDHLLGIPLKDWDLEVHGLDVDALERTLRTVGRVSTVGRAFSVFKVHDARTDVDVSLPRRDSKVGPGHRGIQAVGDPSLGLREAARRRDLTVNAMAVDVRTGALLDPWNGQADLAARRLRAVDPDTFLEDPLRALRVVQFAGRLDFDADDALIDLCARARLDELPPERLLGEWAKLLLRGVRPSRGLHIARRAGLIARTLPALVDDDGAADALDRAVPHREALADAPEGRRLALMALVWWDATPSAGVVDTLDRLGLHRWERYRTREVLLAAHAARNDAFDTPVARNHLAARADAELVVRLRAARDRLAVEPAIADLIAREIRERPVPAWVQGRDLAHLGRPAGAWMGTVLDTVYTAQLDQRLPDRDAALALAAELAREG